MLESLYKFLTLLNPQGGAIAWILLVVFFMSVFLDISKIPVNPWKRILRGISHVFNADVIASQKELQTRLEKTCHTFSEKYNELGEKIDAVEMKQLNYQKRTSRRKIIEFADECRRGVGHSQQMFINVFDDINEYEKLCELTGDPNHVIVESIEYIHQIYQKRLDTNDFV